jgi:DNA ligase N terminus
VLLLQKRFKMECPGEDSSLYKLIRIIIASEENERSYGIQEKTIRNLVVTVVSNKGLLFTLLKYNNLKLYFNLGSANAKKIEKCNEQEIADTVYQIIKSDKIGKLTIVDVDEALNNLSSNQTKREQINILTTLYQKGTALDFKW